LISAPTDNFKNKTYSHILDNVAPKIRMPKSLSPSLQKLINWPSTEITEYDCEVLICRYHFKMHEICRMDPEPILKSGRNPKSKAVEDYQFGVSGELITEYIKYADGLMVFRYGKDRLTPYMIKCIDIVPILLRDLPIRSMLRASIYREWRKTALHASNEVLPAHFKRWRLGFSGPCFTNT
jgi:hypothetical protein